MPTNQISVAANNRGDVPALLGALNPDVLARVTVHAVDAVEPLVERLLATTTSEAEIEKDVERLVRWLTRSPVHLVLIGIAALWLVPTVALLVTSFRPRSDALSMRSMPCCRRWFSLSLKGAMRRCCRMSRRTTPC